MIRATLLAAAVALATQTGQAASYDPPEGCDVIATMRRAQCVVEHVSRCAEGNIADQFRDGKYLGRSVYTHPSMFVRYEAANGFIVGHAYGDGAPRLGDSLKTGDRHTYTRRVFRSQGDDQPGDEGTEVMEIGDEIDIDLDGKRYRVLDIRFDVSNSDTGYHYRERALMMIEPALTLGSLGYVKGEEEFSTLPESISLQGDFGFRSMTPAASCGEGT